MCKYCRELKEKTISGAYLELTPTKRTEEKQIYYEPKCFILKCKKDKKAGLMINNYKCCHYIDINYCPMCGRKLGE